VHAVLFVAVWIAVASLPLNPKLDGAWRGFPEAPMLDGWARWDSGWYRDIAERGYSFTPGKQSSVAFFPGFPLAMRGLGALLTGGNVLLAGILLSLLAGAAATLLFFAWVRERLDAETARVATLGLILYPFAYYFGAVYSDAFFLMLAIAAFVALEKDRPVLAGALGALASGTRLVGVAVAVGLAVRAFERRDFRLKSLAPRDFGVLIAPAGLIAYVIYLAIGFGHPFAFTETTAAPGWDLAPSPRVWLKLEALEILTSSNPLSFKASRIWLQLGLSLTALALLPAVKRAFGWGYFAYTLVAVGLPFIGTKDFIGMGRYLLAAFPLFAIVGIILAKRTNRRLRLLIAVPSGALLVAFSIAYGLWYYVS
jgi:hypothetical protein